MHIFVFWATESHRTKFFPFEDWTITLFFCQYVKNYHGLLLWIIGCLIRNSIQVGSYVLLVFHFNLYDFPQTVFCSYFLWSILTWTWVGSSNLQLTWYRHMFLSLIFRRPFCFGFVTCCILAHIYNLFSFKNYLR